MYAMFCFQACELPFRHDFLTEWRTALWRYSTTFLRPNAFKQIVREGRSISVPSSTSRFDPMQLLSRDYVIDQVFRELSENVLDLEAKPRKAVQVLLQKPFKTFLKTWNTDF